MIYSVRQRCVLDTNVIYPLWIRDILLWFAYYELFIPKWSRHIFDEWLDVMDRKGISKENARKRVEMVNSAFPDALVKNYEYLIKALSLPDEKDNHVLAAAIETNASLIVTNNLKDFPGDYLARFGLKAKNPDDFLSDIIDIEHKTSLEAFRELVQNKKNPPYDEFEVLDIFRRNGLKNTADYFHSLL